MNKLVLAYCVENQFVAAKIASALDGKMMIEKVVFENDFGIGRLMLAAKDNAAPVLLLLSDNFLKSEKCMSGALSLIQSLSNARRLIPVTTDGVYTNNGRMVSLPTTFDRVSNVIQYMNFWQDRYLELRRTKPTGDELVFNERVRVVRDISSEIGELLRFLRTTEYYSYDQFEESNFVILYRLMGIDASAYVEKSRQLEVGKTILPPQYEESMNRNGRSNKYEADVAVIEPPITAKIAEPVAEILDLPLNPIPTASPQEEKEHKEAFDARAHDLIHQGVNTPSTLETLIDNIRQEEEYRVEKAPEISPEFSKVVDALVSEDDRTVEEMLDKSPLHAKSFTLEEILLDEELKDMMKKQTPTESLDKLFEIEEEIPAFLKEESQNAPSPIASKMNELDDILDPEEEDLLKKIAAETEAELAADTNSTKATVVENFTEKSDDALQANMPHETLSEGDIAQLFEKAEEVEEQFDFDRIETETLEAVENQVVETESADSLSADVALVDLPHTIQIDSHTEGVENLETWHDLLKMNPLNNSLRYKVAAELANQNKLAEANEQLEIVLENDRTNIEAYILLAYIAEQQGDYTLSLNSLEKVTLLNPNYPGIYYKLGRLTTEHFVKQNRKALRFFKEAVMQDPQNGEAQYQYALLLIEQNNDYKTAIEHLLIASSEAPQNDGAAYELAKAYVEIGDRAAAAEWYARAIELNPSLKSDSDDQFFKYEAPAATITAEPDKVYNDNGITVLITGASSGIGRATAEIFAKNGYRTILTGRRSDRLAEMKTAFETEFNNRVALLSFDVRNLDAVKLAMTQLEDTFSAVDILINNAGLASGLAPIHEGDIDDWEAMIDTNVKGLLYMTRAIVPTMVARKKGHIVNIGSIAGKEIYPNGNVYCASKFAVDALTRAMRVDLHKYNIRVSQVSPGAVEETEFALVRFHGDKERAKIYEDFTPLKASDVAETIYFMVTRPEYVNIQDITMMGTQQASANHFDRSGRK
jgi:NADP-dependent 3-hydroxy acid dehydrogenase YdfG/Flp pilus assembly protein TadD